MVVSSTAKVVSGLALTSVAVAGTAWVYKYVHELFAIEKVAIDSEIWTVSEVKNVDSEDEFKALKVEVSVDIDKQTTNKHGLESGTWKCEITTFLFKQSESDDKQTTLKNALNKYFPGYSASTTPFKSQVERIHRENFVNECAGNRKLTEDQGNSKITAELKISAIDPAKSLEFIFEEDSNTISLNSIETKVASGTGLNFAVNSFTLDKGTSPQKATGTITATNSSGTTPLGNNESWTCTIEAAPISGVNLTSGDIKDDLKTSLETELNKPVAKQGLVKSCARNRTSELSATTVTSTLKLDVSKNGNNLKFNENQLNKVFKGDWINPKA